MTIRTTSTSSNVATGPMHVAGGGARSDDPPGYRPADVNRELNPIAASFEDGTVWKTESKAAADGIAALSPAERRSLVNNLAGMPQGDGNMLDRFLGEVTSAGIAGYGGLGADRRTALMRDLVPGQDGANLERIFHGLRRQQGDGSEACQRARRRHQLPPLEGDAATLA